MAYEDGNPNIPGIVAAADLSAKQFTMVAIDSNGKAAANTTAGAVCAGVLQDKPSSADRAAAVKPFGVSKAYAGATVASGARFMSDTAGKAITATSTNYAMGIVLKGGDANELITVFLGIGTGTVA